MPELTATVETIDVDLVPCLDGDCNARMGFTVEEQDELFEMDVDEIPQCPDPGCHFSINQHFTPNDIVDGTRVRLRIEG